MRKSIIYFVIIFLCILPNIVLAEESFIVKPLPSLMNKLDSKGKKTYKTFCNTMTIHHVNLNLLFMTDYFPRSQNPKNEWQAICESAKMDIKRGRTIITYVSKGSEARNEGVQWFNSLMSLFKKLENEGSRAFDEKLMIDRMIWDKSKSVRNNKVIKKCDQDDINYLDEKIGIAKSLLEANNKETWEKAYQAKNSGNTFENEFRKVQTFGQNFAYVIMQTKKKITKNAKDDEPDRYEGGEGHLDGWAIDHEYRYFSNFKNVRFSWQENIKIHHKKYEKLYETWYDELEYIFNDTIFRNTRHMKGWKWDNLGAKINKIYNDMLPSGTFYGDTQIIYDTR